MEGMLELRQQGFFRWGWAREQGVIASLVEIGRFGDADAQAKIMFGNEVSKSGGCLTLHHRDMHGLERQSKNFGKGERYYWRVRGVDGIASRERLAALEADLSSRHRRARLDSVIAFRTSGMAGEAELDTEVEFLVQEFISLDQPHLIDEYGDFLQVAAAEGQSGRPGRAARRSARHDDVFYALIDNLMELLGRGVIAVKGLCSSVDGKLHAVEFELPVPVPKTRQDESEWSSELTRTPQKTKLAAGAMSTPPRGKWSSYTVYDGKRRISPAMILYIAGHVENSCAQTRMMQSLHLAANAFGVEMTDDGVSERTISRVHGMCGVLAMAHTTAGLINAGRLEETRCLMADGATVRDHTHPHS